MSDLPNWLLAVLVILGPVLLGGAFIYSRTKNKNTPMSGTDRRRQHDATKELYKDRPDTKP